MSGRQHKHEKIHKNQPKDFLDYLVYFFTFATPLLEIPQALEIYFSRSAENVSLWTWGFFCLDNFVWIIYAWRRRLWPVLITSLLFEIIEFAVFIGIILYR